MKTATKSLLYEFIRQKGNTTAREIIDFTQYHPTGVFKHLKTLQEHGIIYKIGKPPKVRYHAYVHTMGENSPTVRDAMNWAMSGDARFVRQATLCQTRDVLQARTDRLITDLKKMIANENLVYLTVAIASEIGNNSFDHNLGHWRDTPGVYFYLDTEKRILILADRGQGVFATIQRVRPEVKHDADALQIAFTEMVSGRSPEKRGNGLKFVKKIIEENQLRLTYYTGRAVAELQTRGMTITPGEQTIPGTLAILQF